MAETLAPHSTVLMAPELTLPDTEAAALGDALTRAGSYLEYGSGGSTVLAASAPGRQVMSVESDPDWAAQMRAWFAAHPGPSPVTLHHADIGPVRAWGHPANDAAFRRWPDYAHSVWERADFAHPDLVLIDGRFRAACFATVALRITRPVVVLFDDYVSRKAYHTVEQLARPTGFAGRMARFELSPMVLPRALTGWYAGLFSHAQ